MYPSIIHENNIASNTQIGRIEIDEKIYDNENVYRYETYSRGGEFVENIDTSNHIEFCHRWFKLANIKEMIQDMDEYYNAIGLGKYSQLDICYRTTLVPTSNYPIKPFVKDDKSYHSPVIFTNKRNSSITYDTLMKEVI